MNACNPQMTREEIQSLVDSHRPKEREKAVAYAVSLLTSAAALGSEVRPDDRAQLRQRRGRPSERWHLDEMVIRIAGEHLYLWRAVDHEGEVLDMLVQRRRDR